MTILLQNIIFAIGAWGLCSFMVALMLDVIPFKKKDL